MTGEEPTHPTAPGEPAEALEELAEAAEHAAEEVSRFGTPGKPFSRSPFLTGLVGGAGLITAYVAYQAVVNVWSMLLLIFVAAFLAVGLNPAVVKLRAWGLNRGLAVAIVGLAMVLVFCGGIAALIPPLVQQGDQVIGKFPDYLQQLTHNQWLHDLDKKYDIITKVKEAATATNISNLFGGVLGGVSTLFGTMFNALMTVVLTFYFLAAFDRLKSGAYKLVPASRRVRAERLGDEILAKVGGYMIGAIGIAAVAGVASYIFMLIVGIPYAYALALLVAILDLIPQVGATLGAVIVCIVGFAAGSVGVGIACVVFFVVYQQLENWIIYPKVMNRAVAVTDLAAIIGVLVGVALLGVVGALIAVPAVAAMQLIIREVAMPRQDQC
ncbi:AI-2E family transporter [Longispora fulva]|uniref:Putative PurR-regulated permease PerM n=1 Tax=Longispora fulva TaxID=619741 RepID=A0A8J7GM88_9ACTN|nr:AI-2E family transporter [Longispora fulva]MBG6140891.1 putative PurR-regulated permease PerM [Longispora fulva]GIG60843.1 AI-2E family transporter [Longispora fulva]